MLLEKEQIDLRVHSYTHSVWTWLKSKLNTWGDAMRFFYYFFFTYNLVALRRRNA